MHTLSRSEQEYLTHALEAALQVQDRAGFFLWSQGPLQALLPHRLLVWLQLGPDGNPQAAECVHSEVLPAALRRALADPEAGLAVRLLRQRGSQLPQLLQADVDGADAAALGMLGLRNVLVHGGSGSFFLLCDVAGDGERCAWLLRLLMPQLHWLAQCCAARPALARPLSAREAEILHWLREGKSNSEIGMILGISAMTVKNHLQRVYRVLGVSTRAHAVARSFVSNCRTLQ
ncbi:LuxR C-terminal-related transcriptional regulator [Massilia sp. SM-13]|uniref:LuxR C-terminal-related transcriptional regulator n=1 Tax=Pseudoduganella rhizocola TaxID=3382643 RepID=UPI0038B459FA